MPSAFAAKDGGGIIVGGGGDIWGFEVTTFARNIVTLMKSTSHCQVPGLTASALENAINTTLVRSEPELILNGEPVTFIAYPSEDPAQRLIKVSQKRWDSSKLKELGRMGTTLHEYLRILGLSEPGASSDDHYERSPFISCLTANVYFSREMVSATRGLLAIQSYTLEGLRLAEAVVSGDLTAIESAINDGAYINSSYRVLFLDGAYSYSGMGSLARNRIIDRRQEMSVLGLAAMNNQVDVIQSLIKLGADLESYSDQDMHHRSALVWAARFGNIQAADTLISAGAKFDFSWVSAIENEKEITRSWSALGAAASAGGLSMVKFLLKKGANPCYDLGRYYKYTAWRVARPFDGMIGHNDIELALIEAEKKSGCYREEFLGDSISASLSMRGGYQLVGQDAQGAGHCSRYLYIKTYWDKSSEQLGYFIAGAPNSVDQAVDLAVANGPNRTCSITQGGEESLKFGTKKSMPYLHIECDNGTNTEDHYRIAADDEILYRDYSRGDTNFQCIYRRVGD